MIPIRPVPKRYAWGSCDRLQSLVPAMRGVLGPLAELWYGGHPQSPSTVDIRGVEAPLDDMIRGDPDRMLGVVASHRWGPMLPYLLKVIAVRTPLSLQVHPLDFEARAGFHRENAAGVPLDARERSFRDVHGKSEMVVALDDFRASIGFAPIAMQIAALRLVDHDRARLMVRMLEGKADASPAADDAREADSRMPDAAVSWSAPARSVFRAFWVAVASDCDAGKSTDWLALLTAARERLDRHLTAGRMRDGAACSAGVAASPSFMDDVVRLMFDNAVDAARSFPDDPTVLALLMMNPVRLRPGEGAFITPGTPHAYIRGVGAEIMTNSDNVLRAGLTVKYRDVPNALRNLRPMPEPVRRPECFAGVDGVVYRPGLDEFALKLGHVSGAYADAPLDAHAFHETAGIVPPPECASRPRMLVCLSGELRCSSGTGAVVLRQGDAVFVPAADGSIVITARRNGGNAKTGGAYLLASTGL
ncbi:class I mannose-6-phosphate isomerase [Bifidobacterium callimiconis]|uniref:type I phosphomannose isomerase catalytic subunit n=1 Tax=Bifidobacterium callimiconis TaxID=2306973 RepID=UPI001BDCC142|nr:type I phosphomannose isomerase catalytic subunit [Bifidobacterium callimiconis]MBT1177356.1 class I mannose-6-phosphate isomerase [Bifidobacterium callimiconis]